MYDKMPTVNIFCQKAKIITLLPYLPVISPQELFVSIETLNYFVLMYLSVIFF